jgi:hypothetical protein
VSVAAQFGSELLVGRIPGGGTQDDATTKDEGLWGGAGANQGFELAAQVGRQFDGGGKGARHGSPPGEQDMVLSRREHCGNHHLVWLASISTETNELTQDGQQREQVAEILEGTAFAAFLPTVLKAVC